MTSNQQEVWRLAETPEELESTTRIRIGNLDTFFTEIQRNNLDARADSIPFVNHSSIGAQSSRGYLDLFSGRVRPEQTDAMNLVMRERREFESRYGIPPSFLSVQFPVARALGASSFMGATVVLNPEQVRPVMALGTFAQEMNGGLYT